MGMLGKKPENEKKNSYLVFSAKGFILYEKKCSISLKITVNTESVRFSQMGNCKHKKAKIV